MSAVQQTCISQDVMNALKLEEFKHIFQDIILSFFYKKIETPLYIQVDVVGKEALSLIKMQKMYDLNVFDEDMVQIVETFKKATIQGEETTILYSNKLGHMPSSITVKLF